MKTLLRLFAAAAGFGSVACALPAAAVPVMLDFTGTLGSGGDFTSLSGTLTLDVTAGIATSGSGTISIYGLSDVPLSLITVTTPGNEGGDGSTEPVGYRANDGTDLNGADQRYPLSENGMLFDVGTTTPAFGEYPLIDFYSDGSGGFGAQFTGRVNGVEHYNVYDPSNVTFTQAASPSAVPEPASWGLMILGVGAIGCANRRRKPATRVAFAAA